MSKSPQKWTKYGWVNANREDLLQYINPINSSAVSASDLLYLLTTGNTDPLQHLKLSYSIGIPAIELDLMVSGKGILHRMGDTFSKASKKSSINELYLIAHAILETGHGTSELATGIEVKEVNGVPVKPRVVYNMFGI